MYAQAVSKPYKQAHLNRFKGCAFSYEPCVCIKSLKLGDPACGTGGMLSVAEEYLHSLNASTELVSFGQEINDQTFAICKADMLIKGNNADYIKDGNTLSDDQFAGSTFDYILSNEAVICGLTPEKACNFKEFAA